MLTLLTGKPGSGKTVYAVDLILQLSNNKASNLSFINTIYLNIAGFDFDKFDDENVELKKFNFKEFHLHIKLLHDIYLKNENKDNCDDLLILYCKEHNIFDVYFIIDECHNFFNTQDKSLVWWASYHRHLHHEALLLTQDKTLINTKYRGFIELFIEAQPRLKAISKNTMRYFHYSKYLMSQKDKFDTTSITVTPEHFAVYKSGNTSKQKQVGRKFIYMFVVSLFLIVFAFMFLFSKLTPTVPTVEENNSAVSNEKSNPNSMGKENNSLSLNIKLDDYKQIQFMSLKCNTKTKFCYYNNKKISFGTYLKLKDTFDIQELNITQLPNNYVQLDILAHEFFYFIFKGGSKNEKDTNTNRNMLPTTFGK